MWTSRSNLATVEFLIKKKELRLYVKHCGINNVDTVFGFVNSKRFLVYTLFFYKTLTDKLHCLPLPNSIYHMTSGWPEEQQFGILKSCTDETITYIKIGWPWHPWIYHSGTDNITYTSVGIIIEMNEKMKPTYKNIANWIIKARR